MRLTAHTDFGLRILISLACRPGHVATIEDLAERLRLSRNHLMKVATNLVAAGFVSGLRGRGGGLRLARDAALIRAGDVVRALEPDFALAACLGPEPGSCVFCGPCRLTSALERARDAFLRELDAVSLADLAEPAAVLRERIGLPRRAAVG